MIETITHKTDLLASDFVGSLMGKRVKQGQPEVITVQVDDMPSRAYKWTDGIHSCLSIFIPIEQGIKEILVIG